MLPPDTDAWLPDDPVAELALDEAEPPLLGWVPPLDADLFELPLCKLSLFDEPMLPEPLEPRLPEPETLGEPLPGWVPPALFCAESLPMLLPVPSFDF